MATPFLPTLTPRLTALGDLGKAVSGSGSSAGGSSGGGLVSGGVLAAMFLPGSYTFTAPNAGSYTFYLWGPGGPGAAQVGRTAAAAWGGNAGGCAQKTVALAAGQQVPLVVGAAGTPATADNLNTTAATLGTNTTAQLPSGTVTAGYGSAAGPPSGGTFFGPGAASGGDVNQTGGNGGNTYQGGTPATSGDGSYAGTPGATYTMGSPYAYGGGSAPGRAFLGGGNGGAGVRADTTPVGLPGGFPGGGGGGVIATANTQGTASNGANSGGAVGGRGGDGFIVITFGGS